MKYLLQRPHSDELTTSALLRTCRRFQIRISSLMKTLLGRKWSPGLLQFSYVPAVAQAMLLNPEDVLRFHSVFSYCTAFFSAEQLERTKLAVIGLRSSVGLGAVVQSVTQYTPYRRFCPDCAREEFLRTGESFWHLSHHLPGVLMCIPHGRLLSETDLATATGTLALIDALPHELPHAPSLRRTTPFTRALTEQSLLIIQSESPLDGSASNYRLRFAESGLISGARPISESRLIRWAQDRAGNLENIGLSAKDLDWWWLPLMIRPRPAAVAPAFKHAILRALLALSGSDGSKLDYIPSGPPPSDLRERDHAFAVALRDLRLGSSQAGREIGVQGALQTIGAWNSFRHMRSRYPELADEARLLRSPSARGKPVAGATLHPHFKRSGPRKPKIAAAAN
ncbi:TniQ family protein [Variovorax sp. J22R24]|uniref:TniQ family protein n=1 Tax=Variovorax gracilis TaxID=3053502 RepID=UPI0025778A70|nr:TniQ family protein [Variovorax sp. J22R24]MDM0110291.1 TniQ family protein [Variovorax sp. J22R24]